ncbi:concanavalin A-like lectin/glucanase domain-containing protein [Aspergillus varians]
MKQLLPILPLLLRANAHLIPTPSPNLQGLQNLPDLLHPIFPSLNPDRGSGSDSDSSIIPPQLDYTLTWHDEFTSSPSTNNENESHLPSPSNWLFDTGTSYPSGAPNWGNNELETYTTSPTNIHITPLNTLKITPRRQTAPGSETPTWTSARIETARTDFLAPRGGKLYIEARLRTGCAPSSQQQGIWPAFWALGQSFRLDPTLWPMASEWDFVEVINGQPVVYSTLHCGRDRGAGGPCGEYNGLGNGGVRWSGCNWHAVGFEVDRSLGFSSSGGGGGGGGGGWEQETLTWFLDGQQVHAVSGEDVGDEQVWESVAHQGHFLLLNVAVGGNWPGYPDENTVDGEEVALEVDYVRVWNAE